ncbi:MAG: hypothetical protein HUJ31_06155 [Pseudomonadales bacterium]|nr:hypothetical protein [Pseudomonadales bacterium]
MKDLNELLRTVFTGRPAWMSVVMVFCFYMTVIYMPFDLFLKPVERDQEVWFGIVLTGWAAKATEPIHWAIYAAGSWGFYKMKSWMWPWASVYVIQIAIGMFVWTYMREGASNFIVAILVSIPFIALAVALWRAKPQFREQIQAADNSNENMPGSVNEDSE